jgi:hypothetical protein
MLDVLFKDALTSGDIQKIKQITDSLEIIIIKSQRFPDEILSLILDLFAEKYFQDMEESRHILYLLMTNFEFLSAEQKQKLLLALARVYPNLADWMSWFTISEILGECYQDQDALEVIKSLKNIPNDHPRSFLAHSLGHLAKSPDKNLAKAALDELILWQNDSSDRVREEVKLALQKLLI